MKKHLLYIIFRQHSVVFNRGNWCFLYATNLAYQSVLVSYTDKDSGSNWKSLMVNILAHDGL